MGNFLCFDLGTTKIKSALLSYDGNIIYYSEEKAITYSDDKGIYQKPEEYYTAVEKQIKKIEKKHKKTLKILIASYAADRWQVSFQSIKTGKWCFLGHIQ